MQERIDLAIRIAELADSQAIARKLAPNRRVIVAAPAYLARHPAPAEPADLLKHNCLLLRFPGSRQYRWTLQGPDGPMTLRVAGTMDANNGEVLRDWCLAGHGLALKSVWEIVEDLNDGRLRGRAPRHPAAGPRDLRALPAQPLPAGARAGVHRLPRGDLRAGAVLGAGVEGEAAVRRGWARRHNPSLIVISRKREFRTADLTCCPGFRFRALACT